MTNSVTKREKRESFSKNCSSVRKSGANFETSKPFHLIYPPNVVRVGHKSNNDCIRLRSPIDTASNKQSSLQPRSAC